MVFPLFEGGAAKAAGGALNLAIQFTIYFFYFS
jgi:hypothetical protein